MPETFNPITFTNGSGQPLNATNLNAIMAGVESIDDRGALLELGVCTPVVVSYAASLVLNATQGALFRVTATGNLALTDISGGVNGQHIALEVLASGADRVLTVAGSSVTITAGQWWSGAFRYNQGADTWLFVGTGSGGSGGIPASLALAKGDIVVATAGNTFARLPAGTNGQVLAADSTTATGLRWVTPSTGGGTTTGGLGIAPLGTSPLGS